MSYDAAFFAVGIAFGFVISWIMHQIQLMKCQAMRAIAERERDDLLFEKQRGGFQ